MVARALQVRITFERQRFGADFRAWRKRERMSLEQVARAVGASDSLISRIELGYIVPRAAVLLSMLLLSGMVADDYCTVERDEDTGNADTQGTRQ